MICLLVRNCVMAGQDVSNLIAGIKSHVAYAKTGLAELIAERKNQVLRYATDIDGFQRQVVQLERRIGDLPRLIREAEQEYESKLREASTLEVKADDMDAESKKADTVSKGSSYAAGGTLGLGLLFALPTCIISLYTIVSHYKNNFQKT